MANKHIGSVMIREIIRMKTNGFSNSRISTSLGKSRTTVIKYLTAFQESGFSYTEFLELSDNDLFDLFDPQDPPPLSHRDTIHLELFDFFPYV